MLDSQVFVTSGVYTRYEFFFPFLSPPLFDHEFDISLSHTSPSRKYDYKNEIYIYIYILYETHYLFLDTLLLLPLSLI